MLVKVGLSSGDLTGDSNLALQQAVDAVAGQGGGAVELGPGVFTLYDSIRLRPNVHLVGSGPDTVLRKCDGPASPFALDADYGQAKVTVEDPTGFRPGLGVVVCDDRSGGWHHTVATVTLVQGNVLFLDRFFVTDYARDQNGIVFSAFPPIAAIDVDSVTVEGLTLDGNGRASARINGCVGGGIYLHRARRCRIAHCLVRDFNGDGISFQTTQDITVESCEVAGAAGLGLHPGTGSARPIIRSCKSHHNGEDGLFLCWRVQDGIFEANEFSHNGRHGVSIGHKDTDNLFAGNVVRGNLAHGLYFRDEHPTNAGSRNTFRRNVIEDNHGCGVCIDGHTSDLVFEGNTIRDTRSGPARTQRIGLRAGEHTSRITALRNCIEGHPEADIQGNVTVAE